MFGKNHAIGPNGEQYNPTLFDTENFQPEADAEKLHKAMKGLGTDEAAIIEILGNRTSHERQQIAHTFKSCYGEDLVKELKSELSGKFKKLVKMLLQDPAYLLAEALYHAIKGIGTKEHIIIEVLCTATNEEIVAIKDAYCRVIDDNGNTDLSRDLEEDICGDLSGNFKRVVVALLQAGREEPDWNDVMNVPNNGIWSIIDKNQVEADADELYSAGEGKLGTDEEVFIKLFCRRSFFHICALAAAYESKSGTPLLDAIDSELSGDFEDAVRMIVLSATNRARCFAKLLKRAMKGLGTDDCTLSRIIAYRADIDLKEIMDEFEKENEGQTLEEWVKGDTSGDYQKLLLALMGKASD